MILIFTCGIGLGLNSIAQTKLIAFKSHSGNLAFFNPSAGPDNLGCQRADFNYLEETTYILDTLSWLSDTSVIVRIATSNIQGIIKIDTVISFPYCSKPDLEYSQYKPIYPGQITNPAYTKKDTTVLDTLENQNDINFIPVEKNNTIDQKAINNEVYLTENESNVSYLIYAIFALILSLSLIIWKTQKEKSLV